MSNKVIKNKSSTERIYHGIVIPAISNHTIADIDVHRIREDDDLLYDLLNDSDIVMAHAGDTSIEFGGQLGIDFLNMHVPKSPLIIFGQLINGEYTQQISDTTYTTLFTFIDSNSSENGVPIKMSIEAYLHDGDTYDVRLYDFTNSNTLVEKTGMSNLTREIIEIGRIDGITTSPAILEIQARSFGTKREAHIYSALIEYD